MTKLPLITVPFFAVIVLVGVAFTMKMQNATVVPTVAETGVYEPTPYEDTSEKKPSNFFGSLFQSVPTPTPTPASALDLSRELSGIGDDGGASDFTTLQAEASGL